MTAGTPETSSKSPETFLSKVSFDSSLVERAVNSVTHQGLKAVAESFGKNIEAATNLLQLPHSLLMHAYAKEKQYLAFLDVYLPLAMKGLSYDDAAVKKSVDDEVAKRLNAWHENEAVKELGRESDKALAFLLESDVVQRQVRMLLISLISATWTAFEVLAGDAWQLALNAEPNKTAEAVLKRFFPNSSADGISAKGIPI
jgi:hypothetical protein